MHRLVWVWRNENLFKVPRQWLYSMKKVFKTYSCKDIHYLPFECKPKADKWTRCLWFPIHSFTLLLLMRVTQNTTYSRRLWVIRMTSCHWPKGKKEVSLNGVSLCLPSPQKAFLDSLKKDKWEKTGKLMNVGDKWVGILMLTLLPPSERVSVSWIAANATVYFSMTDEISYLERKYLLLVDFLSFLVEDSVK